MTLTVEVCKRRLEEIAEYDDDANIKSEVAKILKLVDERRRRVIRTWAVNELGKPPELVFTSALRRINKRTAMLQAVLDLTETAAVK
jgi:hypothetical protein